jgi:hypothetical protein
MVNLMVTSVHNGSQVTDDVIEAIESDGGNCASLDIECGARQEIVVTIELRASDEMLCLLFGK